MITVNGEILAADDDPVVRHILSLFLAPTGAKLRLVEDGAACLAAVRERRPEILFLDMQLPDMSGLDVLREVRASVPELPVILLSANPRGEVIGVVESDAPDYYLEKPFTAEAVYAALEEVLGEKKS